MYLSPVDGRWHVSKTDDLNQLPDGAFYMTDDPYPDPKYTGGTPVATVEERLKALEVQVPLQTEGLRRVTEGKYNGAQGSGAIVVALEGGQTTIKPQPDFK